MATTFTTDTQIRQFITDLAGETDELETDYFSGLTQYSLIATAARTDAYNLIKRVLMARGLTAAQVALWTEGKAYELDIATYFFGQRVGWEKKVDGEAPWISRFDRRKELKTMLILLSDGTVIENEVKGTALDSTDFDVGATRLIGDYKNGQSGN